MADESTAEAWLDSLQEILERDLIHTGFITGATHQYWSILGYDDPENPNYQISRDYVYALSERLKLPPTNDLSEFETEYQQRHYTRRCLQSGQPAAQCLLGASEYSHLDVINASLPLLTSDNREEVQSAVITAIDADRLDIVTILDPYVIMMDSNDPDYEDVVDDEYLVITEHAARTGRLDILKHELEYAARVHKYVPSGMYLNIMAGDIPTLAYTLETFEEDAIENFSEIVDDALEDGNIWKIKYLQTWSQSGRLGLVPLTTEYILKRAINFNQPNVLAAFVGDWAPGFTCHQIESTIPI